MTARLVLFAVLAASAILSFAAPTPPTFRLPDTARPLRYDLRLAIDPRTPEFAGEVTIEMAVARPTGIVWLNALAITVDRAQVTQAGRDVPVRVVPGGEDFVGLEGAFAAGEARVRIEYRARLDETSVDGAFRQRDEGEWYVLTQFQPVGARRAIPCFDEPGFKTPWKLTLDAPTGSVVVANTPEVRTAAIGSRPGWTRHEFAPTRPLPSYLVAFAIGPFDVVDGGKAGRNHTPLRYLTPKGRGAQARYAAAVTPRLIELLEDYFGTPHPFEKLDSITIPDVVTFAAMENVGLITYGKRWLLAERREEMRKFRETYVSLAAHEIAHMWFGNSVTLAWWDDTWLNEAFASWIATRVTYEFEPRWNNGVYRTDVRNTALLADRLAASRSIAQAVQAKNEIDNAFDDITYYKGEEVLSMFEAYLGPERFRAGVRLFLQRHAYGSANSADFFRALGEASGSPDAAVRALGGFVNQPGAPMIDVALDCTGARPALKVSQRRLRPAGSSAPELQWTTPACFAYPAAGKVDTQCAAIDAATTRVELPKLDACPAWIVGNAHGVGHYVARYDAALLARITARAADLPQAEAQVLAKDALILAGAGLMPVAAALRVAEASAAHVSPNVRLAVVQLLEGLEDDWLAPADRLEKDRITAQRLAPRARELGWTPRATDPDDVRELRPALLAYAAAHASGEFLRPQARALAMRWIDDRKAIDPTTVKAVLEVAGRFADPILFERLENAAATSESGRERTMILGALARASARSLRDRALRLTLTVRNGKPRVDGRTALALIDAMLRDDLNRETAFDFVRSNRAAIEAKLPREALSSLLIPMGSLCRPRDRIAFVAAFAGPSRDYFSGPLRYAQALESIDLCIAARGR